MLPAQERVRNGEGPSHSFLADFEILSKQEVKKKSKMSHNTYYWQVHWETDTHTWLVEI